MFRLFPKGHQHGSDSFAAPRASRAQRLSKAPVTSGHSRRTLWLSSREAWAVCCEQCLQGITAERPDPPWERIRPESIAPWKQPSPRLASGGREGCLLTAIVSAKMISIVVWTARVLWRFGDFPLVPGVFWGRIGNRQWREELHIYSLLPRETSLC